MTQRKMDLAQIALEICAQIADPAKCTAVAAGDAEAQCKMDFAQRRNENGSRGKVQYKTSSLYSLPLAPCSLLRAIPIFVK